MHRSFGSDQTEPEQRSNVVDQASIVAARYCVVPQMLQEAEPPVNGRDVAITLPLLAGPGTLTTVILLMSDSDGISVDGIVAAMVVAVVYCVSEPLTT